MKSLSLRLQLLLVFEKKGGYIATDDFLAILMDMINYTNSNIVALHRELF